MNFLCRVLNCKTRNPWEWLLLYGAHWWECVSHLLHSVGVCVWESERERERAVRHSVTCRSPGAPFCSTHAASICYVTLLFSHSFPARLSPSLLFLCLHTPRLFLRIWLRGNRVSMPQSKHVTMQHTTPWKTISFFFFWGPCFFDCARKQILLCIHAATNRHNVRFYVAILQAPALCIENKTFLLSECECTYWFAELVFSAHYLLGCWGEVAAILHVRVLDI